MVCSLFAWIASSKKGNQLPDPKWPVQTQNVPLFSPSSGTEARCLRPHFNPQRFSATTKMANYPQFRNSGAWKTNKHEKPSPPRNETRPTGRLEGGAWRSSARPSWSWRTWKRSEANYFRGTVPQHDLPLVSSLPSPRNGEFHPSLGSSRFERLELRLPDFFQLCRF